MMTHSLLDNISEESINKMIPCFKPVTRKYMPGEVMMLYPNYDSDKQLAVLLDGNARLDMFNDTGESFMLERYRKNQVIGAFSCLPLEDFNYSITAETNCTVIYINYKHIISPCHNLCEHHSQLISNLFLMAAEKTRDISMHISIMQQPSIREKIYMFLKYVRSQSTGAKTTSSSFFLPLSLTDMSEYIGVNRSAMMRELKSMENDGLIKHSGREFRII